LLRPTCRSKKNGLDCGVYALEYCTRLASDPGARQLLWDKGQLPRRWVTQRCVEHRRQQLRKLISFIFERGGDVAEVCKDEESRAEILHLLTSDPPSSGKKRKNPAKHSNLDVLQPVKCLGLVKKTSGVKKTTGKPAAPPALQIPPRFIPSKDRQRLQTALWKKGTPVEYQKRPGFWVLTMVAQTTAFGEVSVEAEREHFLSIQEQQDMLRPAPGSKEATMLAEVRKEKSAKVKAYEALERAKRLKKKAKTDKLLRARAKKAAMGKVNKMKSRTRRTA